MVPALLAETRLAVVIFCPPLNCFAGDFARWSASRLPYRHPRKSSLTEFILHHANLTPGFERPKLMPSGKKQLFSSTDE